MHYDHIFDYSENREHDPSNITLLCGSHHDQKTRHLLPRDRVVAANQNPAAITNPELVRERLSFSSPQTSFLIATNRFGTQLSNGDTYTVFAVNDMTPFTITLENGITLISLVMTDETGRVLLQIDKNEIIFMPSSGDIEVIGSVITIRESPRKIVLQLELNPKDDLINIKRGHLVIGNTAVVFSDTSFSILDSHKRRNIVTMSGCSFFGGQVAHSISSPLFPGMCMIQ